MNTSLDNAQLNLVNRTHRHRVRRAPAKVLAGARVGLRLLDNDYPHPNADVERHLISLERTTDGICSSINWTFVEVFGIGYPPLVHAIKISEFDALYSALLSLPQIVRDCCDVLKSRMPPVSSETPFKSVTALTLIEAQAKTLPELPARLIAVKAALFEYESGIMALGH